MNASEFTNIALRVLAVYIISQGVMQVPSFTSMLIFSSFPVNESTNMLPLTILMFLTPILFGIGLWMGSNKLTGLILENLDSTPNSSISIPNIQAAIISMLGFVLIIYSIPQLTSNLINLFSMMDVVDDEKVFKIEILSYSIALAVKVLLGISLILQTSGWIRLINKIRFLGYK